MKYKAVIFDLDGTILNTLEDLADALNHALNCFKQPLITLEQARSYIGNGGRLFVSRAVKDQTLVDEILPVFFTYYQNHCDLKTRPYDGIIELVKQLRQQGVKCGVVTNKFDEAANELTSKYFENCFDVTIGQKEGVNIKPAPDSVNEVLRIFAVEKKDAIYIGDSEVDLQTAKNAGLECISVTYGFRNQKQLVEAGATKLADSVEDILKYLI